MFLNIKHFSLNMNIFSLNIKIHFCYKSATIITGLSELAFRHKIYFDITNKRIDFYEL